MKNLVLLFVFAFTAFLNQTYSQTSEIYIMDSSSMCTNNKLIVLWFQVGSVDEVNPVITVNWGDGNSSVINSVTYPANSFQTLEFDHTYTVYGTYIISVTFESSVTSDVLTSNQLTVAINDVSNCGYIYANVYQNTICGQFWGSYMQDAVMDLTGNDNTVTNFTGYVTGINVNNVPYTLSLNEDWLAANNLTQTNPDLIITGFDPYGYPIFDGQNSMLTVSSTNTSTTTDLATHYGYSVGFSASENAYINFMLLDISCAGTTNVSVSVELPSFFTPVTADLTNPVVSGNTLTFEIPGFTGYDWIYIPGTIPGTTQAGTEIHATVTVSDMSGNETVTGNNSVEIYGIVYNSYDPNDKLVNRPQIINPDEAEELQYTINFQNEGNFEALNITVRDTLSANLDLTTFKVLYTKHNVVTSLNPDTRVATFTFSNINLVPSSTDMEGSKGQIVYSVKEKENLPLESEIENTAYIYFDFNPAIVTNTTYNRNSVLAVGELKKNFVSIYPNPANLSITINSKAIDNQVKIQDINGKTVLATHFVKTASLDVSALSNGVYYLLLENSEGVNVEKIAIRH